MQTSTTASPTSPIIILPLLVTVMIILFFIIYASRYRKFSINEYVIWLRNGEVRKAEIGGAGWLQPLADIAIVLPTAMQLTKLNIKLDAYQQAQGSLIIDLELNWRIIQPELFYRRFYSMREKIRYDELEETYKNYLRELLALKTINDIYGKTRSMIRELKDILNDHLKENGILLESIEIETVTRL